jgi:hypothetical protein
MHHPDQAAWQDLAAWQPTCVTVSIYLMIEMEVAGVVYLMMLSDLTYR